MFRSGIVCLFFKMEGKKDLYKKRALGQASREVRGKIKAQESRTRREVLLDSKRNITKRSENPKAGPRSKAIVSKETSSRLEQLKQWKKAREEAKTKTKQTRKPFGYGLSNTSVKPALNTKPVKPKISSTFNKPEASAVPKTSTSSLAGKKQGTATRTTKLSTDSLKAKQQKKPALKPKLDVSRPLTRSMSKSAVSKVKAESKQSCSTKIQSRTKGKAASSIKKTGPIKAVRVTRSTAVVTTTETVEVLDNTDYELPEPRSPAISPVALKYNPAKPSPLLRSHSAKRCRDSRLFAAPMPIDDPAWIPGGVEVNENFSQPNFDEAFGTFSPFKFGDSNENMEFTFKKKYSFSSDSLENIQTPTTKTARRCSLRSPVVKSMSVNDKAMIVELAEPQEEEAMDTQDSCISEGEKLGIDLVYFRKLHSDVTGILTSLCELWEKKIAAIEKDQTDGIALDMEDGLGQVRLTVCQARLLMRQKLKQYAGLVDTAEVQSGERKTTAEDLQGFWDMVYFQVEDIYSKFHGLEALEKRGYIVKAPTPKKRKTTKKRAVKAAASNSSGEESERMQAAREKREAQRNKLREMKMAAKRVGTNKENVCTPKKIKIDSPRTGSAYKAGRRRSLRVSNKSMFSPASTEKSLCAQSYTNAPIAPLISFD